MSWFRVAWFCISKRTIAGFVLAVLGFVPCCARAQSILIDKANSAVTIRVYKSGLFSGLAHNHIIQAPIAAGSIDIRAQTVDLSFNVSEMKVVDPDDSDSERQEIEATMKGTKVLDMALFPSISFSSGVVTASGPGHSQVTSTLKLHGASHEISVPVVLRDGKYTGSVTLKQTEYGITPVKIAGGAVSVKNEIVIEFGVAPVSGGTRQ